MDAAALHFWLEMISSVIPGFSVKDTLIKTLCAPPRAAPRRTPRWLGRAPPLHVTLVWACGSLGQSIFGPLITAVFFGASLAERTWTR